MKNTFRNIFCWVVLAASLILASCSDDSTGNATIEVYLTDAPGEYNEVNVDIQDVQVHAGDGDSDNGWTSLSVNKGVYDLLEFTNGLDTLLGSTTVPAGKISQVRLILGDNNTVVVDGVSTKLTTPSAQQSGLKIQINTDLKEGVTYKIILDFDAARSIVATGSGKYNLKPVIRAITTALDGGITGTVMPMSAKPVVYAINGVDTVSTFTNESGSFLVRGLATATYRLVLVAGDGAVREKTDVKVNTGDVTDVGVINF
ncbi:MAG TPA: DUF4382 domain-containing protein [Cyclobacteriaceae bacterium]|nr:DUF4382 domain-containing protein [Cyclobacteriaceae bacterium]